MCFFFFNMLVWSILNTHLQKLLRAAMLGLLGVNVVRCALRSQQWRSEQSLFTSALSVCPLNAKVRSCLRLTPFSYKGRVLCFAITCGTCICTWVLKKKKVKLSKTQQCSNSKAIDLFWLSSFLLQVHYNVGKNLADRGNQSAAIKYYREAVRFVLRNVFY